MTPTIPEPGNRRFGSESRDAIEWKRRPSNTVIETLRKLREALDVASADRDSKAAKVATLEKEVLGLRAQYNNQVENSASKPKTPNEPNWKLSADRDEKVQVKIQEIARLKTDINSARDELEQERESREKERKLLNSEISGLSIRVDFLKDKIDNLEKLSFEVADGVIRRVNIPRIRCGSVSARQII